MLKWPIIASCYLPKSIKANLVTTSLLVSRTALLTSPFLSLLSSLSFLIEALLSFDRRHFWTFMVAPRILREFTDLGLSPWSGNAF